MSGTQHLEIPGPKEQTPFCPQEKAARKTLYALPANHIIMGGFLLQAATHSLMNHTLKLQELVSPRNQEGLGNPQRGRGNSAEPGEPC